jgi:pheromone shutdown-related protein TraB
MLPIKIIGTSHIAKESVNEIKQEIKNNQPDIVALELDLQRAASLMQKETRKVGMRDALKIGVKGYLFVKIGQFVQQKLGKMVGVAPGSEMKTALETAKKEKIQVALIDQPITITLKNFSKNLTWKEKFRFVGDIFKGIFFRKRQMKQLGLDQFDLTKVPEKELIKKMMGQMKKRYPNVYKTLVSDRNKYMVKKLVQVMRKNPGKNILAVVGAGHKEGMEKLLLKVEIV